jgi:hypothetical protein
LYADYATTTEVRTTIEKPPEWPLTCTGRRTLITRVTGEDGQTVM